MSNCLKSLGISRDVEQLTDLGKRIWKVKNQVKAKLGFNQKDIVFPRRFFETETMHGMLEEAKLYEAMDRYIAKRDELMAAIPG